MEYSGGMKTILCYGDSNTHGANPSGGRWEYSKRWPGILASLLGDEYYVIEEGLGGRTTVFDDPFGVCRNGKTYLPVALATHQPLDLLIISLGTNDTKRYLGTDERTIAGGIEELATIAKLFEVKQIMVISPIHIGPRIEETIFPGFTKESVAISHKVSDRIKVIAENEGLIFFDAATVATYSEIDQLHMDESSHRSLAEALSEVIKTYL